MIMKENAKNNTKDNKYPPMNISTLVKLVTSSQNQDKVDKELLDSFCYNYAYIKMVNGVIKSLESAWDKSKLDELKIFNKKLKEEIPNLPDETEDYTSVYIKAFQSGIEKFLNQE